MPKVEIRSESCKACEYCIVTCPKKYLRLAQPTTPRGITMSFRPILMPASAANCAQSFAPTLPSKSTNKEDTSWKRDS